MKLSRQYRVKLNIKKWGLAIKGNNRKEILGLSYIYYAIEEWGYDIIISTSNKSISSLRAQRLWNTVVDNSPLHDLLAPTRTSMSRNRGHN